METSAQNVSTRLQSATPEVDPTGSSRWHLSTCKDPRVDVDTKGNVSCKSCNRAPNIAKLISAQPPHGSINVPPDEPPGAYNLFWPPDVPYYTANSQEDGTRREFTNASDSTEYKQSQPAPTPAMSESAIYQQRLDPNQFRLISLPVTSHSNAPIHMALHVYDDKRHPEYETVSYMWGGENGDSTPCQPVYIGPYWDVLLQTQNCFDMLEYLRPSIGVGARLIWVDAICINQEDNLEKNEQVARMAARYKRCRRVVVYLGADLVQPTHGRYPLRRTVDEAMSRSSIDTLTHAPSEGQDQDRGSGQIALFNDDGSLDLIRLLQRQYFSRVWVIQELILASQVAFQVGEVEFRLDASALAHLESKTNLGWKWQDTAAPWVQHACKSNNLDINLMELLTVSAGTKSSDPRDKVFGLLALVDGSRRDTLRPNYALSERHIRLGATAHILLTQKNPEILALNSRWSDCGQDPSWVPNWDSWLSWRDDSTAYSKFNMFDKHVSHYLLHGVGIPMPEDPGIQFSGHFGYKMKLLVPEPYQWHKDASVDAATGALKITLTKVLDFHTLPTPIRPAEATYAYKVLPSRKIDQRNLREQEIMESDWGIILHSRHSDLQKLVKPQDQ